MFRPRRGRRSGKGEIIGERKEVDWVCLPDQQGQLNFPQPPFSFRSHDLQKGEEECQRPLNQNMRTIHLGGQSTVQICFVPSVPSAETYLSSSEVRNRHHDWHGKWFRMGMWLTLRPSFLHADQQFFLLEHRRELDEARARIWMPDRHARSCR